MWRGGGGDRRVGCGGLSLCGTLLEVHPCKDAPPRSNCRFFFVLCVVCAHSPPRSSLSLAWCPCLWNARIVMVLALSCCYLLSCPLPFVTFFFFFWPLLLPPLPSPLRFPPPLVAASPSYILEGGGYFDIRSPADEWVRIAVTPGDMIVLPAGAYHRFTVDEGATVRAVRLFRDAPSWTPVPRGSGDGCGDGLSCRKMYVAGLGGGAAAVDASA